MNNDTDMIMDWGDVIESDGQEFVMDTVPVLVNGRTMVPARYVSELLGAVVDFDYAVEYGYKTVLINR